MNVFTETIMPIILIILVLPLIGVGLAWWVAGHKADAYNEFCHPKIPITQSQAFWSDIIIDGRCQENK